MGYAAHLWLSRRRHQPNLAVRDTTPMAKHSEIASVQFSRVIPEIKICRAANLMLKRYGASEPSPARLAPTTL